MFQLRLRYLFVTILLAWGIKGDSKPFEIENPDTAAVNRTARGGILDEILDYFWYDEYDEESDEKYIICKNCTVVISPLNISQTTQDDSPPQEKPETTKDIPPSDPEITTEPTSTESSSSSPSEPTNTSPTESSSPSTSSVPPTTSSEPTTRTPEPSTTSGTSTTPPTTETSTSTSSTPPGGGGK